MSQVSTDFEHRDTETQRRYWTRHAISLLLAILLLTIQMHGLGQSSTDPLEMVRQANAAYQAGDYAGAISLYEMVVDSGQADATVYFNLGNAYFESDDLGYALLNYRRAQQFIPRDADLTRNLAITRALRVDVQVDESNWLDNLAVATESILTRHELAMMVFMLWVLWSVGLAVTIIRPDQRNRLRLGLLIGGLMLVGGLILLLGRIYVEDQRPAAVVTAFQSQVLSGPGEQYIPLFTLYSAAEGRILERQGQWVRLLLPDGRQGWLNVESIVEFYCL